MVLVQAERKPLRRGTDLHLLRAEPELPYRCGLKILNKVLSLISFKFKVLPVGSTPETVRSKQEPLWEAHFRPGMQGTLQRREMAEKQVFELT